MWTKQPWKHKNYCQLLLTCKKREKKNKSEYMDYSQVQKSRGKQKKSFFTTKWILEHTSEMRKVFLRVTISTNITQIYRICIQMYFIYMQQFQT